VWKICLDQKNMMGAFVFVCKNNILTKIFVNNLFYKKEKKSYFKTCHLKYV